MTGTVQANRSVTKLRIFIFGIAFILALVGFHSVAQAEVKTFTVNTTADADDDGIQPRYV